MESRLTKNILNKQIHYPQIIIDKKKALRVSGTRYQYRMVASSITKSKDRTHSFRLKEQSW